MNEEQKKFQKFADEKISEIFRNESADEIFAELCLKDPSLSKLPKDAFALEYACLRLAVGCIAWVNGCRDNHVADKMVQNLFLKSVMSRFQTPRLLPVASSFSEYLYSSDGTRKNDEVIPLAEKLLQHLVPKKPGGATAAKNQTVECFKMLVEISESLRMHFENELTNMIEDIRGHLT